MNRKRTKIRTKLPARPTKVAVLFTCIGRRVQLLRAFERAAAGLGIHLSTHGADASILSPGVHLVGKAHLVPPIADDGYLDALLEIVRRNRIQLLIPLLDYELPLLASAAEQFEKVGCKALISTEEVVRNCRDKLATHRLLSEADMDTPATWTWEEAVNLKEHRFPYYMKPRFGSAAIGNFVLHNTEDLRTLGRRVQEPIVQEFVSGAEHTVDVYCGFDGRPRCAVPRRRLEIRTGEVSKSLVVKNTRIMEVGCRVAKALAGCRGVVTVQCMLTPEGRIRVIEINPRFGGGVPLAIECGADFPRWILMELLGRRPRIRSDGFRDDVVMLRYDDAVFVKGMSKRFAQLQA